MEATSHLSALTDPNLVIDKTKIPFLVDIIEASYPLHQFWWTPAPADPRTLERDPLQGGVPFSGEWIFGSGTLGGIVEDRETHEKMILVTGMCWPGRITRFKGRASSSRALAIMAQARIRWVPSNGAVFPGNRCCGRAPERRAGLGQRPADIGPVTGVKAPDLGMKVIK